MTDSLSLDELKTLIETLRDGQASAAEYGRLQQLLRENPQARRYYVEYQLLGADLQMLLSVSPDESLCMELTGELESLQQSPRARSAQRVRWLWPIGIAAAALLAVLLGSRLVPWSSRPDATVATVVASMDAHWASGENLPVGAKLAATPLELECGLAEIRFRSGAAVILQGPAECVLESPSHMTLRRGRLSAKVPVEAIGFTVRTAQATVVDLGTEFGVCSAGAGVTDVHVFRGQVALGTQQRNLGRQLLSEGIAKRVEADGTLIEDIRSDELAFVGPREFEARIKALKNSPYHRWLAYSYRLRRDPALVLYYTFDNQSAGFDGVLNRAGATAGKLDGQFGNGTRPQTRPQWVAAGRWPELRALRFDASQQQQLRVPHSKELNITQAMTMAAWVRPHTALLESNTVIVTKSTHAEDQAPTNYELGLTRQFDSHGSARFAVFFHSGSRRITSPALPVAPGQWIHLAAVANGHRTVLYADGQPIAQGTGAELTANEGDLLVGSASHNPHSSAGQGDFAGLLGELLLVRRVLSDSEIAEMVAAGKQEQR